LNDCCAPAYGKVFGERAARRAANRYRSKGLDQDARWIVERAGATRDWEFAEALRAFL
jgi:hypothetical protein